MQIAKHLQQSTLPDLLPNKSKKNKTAPKPKASNKPTLLQRQKLIQQQQQQQHQQQQAFLNKANSYTGDNSSLASSGDISILPNGSSAYSDKVLQENYPKHSYESQNSNWDPNRLSSPASSSFSQNEIISEVEDYMADELSQFLNKRSLSINLTTEEMQEEINQIEQCLNLPKTVNIYLIRFFGREILRF